MYRFSSEFIDPLATGQAACVLEAPRLARPPSASLPLVRLS